MMRHALRMVLETEKMSTKASWLEIPDLANLATASHTWLTALLAASTFLIYTFSTVPLEPGSTRSKRDTHTKSNTDTRSSGQMKISLLSCVGHLSRPSIPADKRPHQVFQDP